MKAQEAKKLWEQVVDDMIGVQWSGISMAPIIKKLKRVKFTYGGEMKRTCHHSSCREGTCEHWYYAVNRFPSLVKEWEKRKELIKIEKNLYEVRNKL